MSPFVSIHVDGVESERPQPPFHRCRSADDLHQRIAGRVVALGDHQLEKLAHGERDATVRMASRQRAAGADVARADRDLAIQ